MDIVEQLREQAKILNANTGGGEYLDDAAEEIELLRIKADHLERELAEYVSASQRLAVERAELRRDVERLRKALAIEAWNRAPRAV